MSQCVPAFRGLQEDRASEAGVVGAGAGGEAKVGGRVVEQRLGCGAGDGGGACGARVAGSRGGGVGAGGRWEARAAGEECGGRG